MLVNALVFPRPPNLPLPGVTTLVMDENHTNTKSSGVQYQAECFYEQEDSQARHNPSSLYNQHTITLCLISDHKNRGQKIR